MHAECGNVWTRKRLQIICFLMLAFLHCLSCCLHSSNTMSCSWPRRISQHCKNFKFVCKQNFYLRICTLTHIYSCDWLLDSCLLNVQWLELALLELLIYTTTTFPLWRQLFCIVTSKFLGNLCDVQSWRSNSNRGVDVTN